MKVFVLLMCQVILVTCKSFHAIPTIRQNPQCSSIVPQADVDWSRLEGDWLHLMFIPGVGNRFMSCRTMKIANVNMTEKKVDFNFNFRTYKGIGKRVRDDSIFYKWFDQPGVIHSSMKYDIRSKAPSKMQLRKKSFMAKLSTSNASKFTAIATDHTNYLILSQCRAYGPPLFWISLKKVTVERPLADEIRSKLLSVGVDATELVLSGEYICLS
ncbi:uncharacterized protein LOC144421104 [Styela clava]